MEIKKQTVFALGFFDGVHLGHQALLAQCRALAETLHARAAAITFDRHPQSVFFATPPLLSSLNDRVALLHRYGMEQVLVLSANEKVMSTDWRDFLTELVERGAVGFVCGDDFRFGSRGAGNAQNLRAFCAERGIPCVVVAQQDMDGARISSTRIRAALERGDLSEANRLLGHPHTLTGVVVQGRHLGRTLGTPTANLQLPQDVLRPMCGVYACLVPVSGGKKVAVTNVGTRPTVDGQGITVEPWILDFAGDLYGKALPLEFHAYLRPERKFADLDELHDQILADSQKARQILEEK